jgi:hypothetical protein
MCVKSGISSQEKRVAGGQLSCAVGGDFSYNYSQEMRYFSASEEEGTYRKTQQVHYTAVVAHLDVGRPPGNWGSFAFAVENAEHQARDGVQAESEARQEGS